MNLVGRSCGKLRRRRVRSRGSMRIGRRLFGCAVRREHSVRIYDTKLTRYLKNVSDH
jgi:hypothetical protein